MKVAAGLALCAMLLAPAARAQDPAGDPTELIDALLSGLMGFTAMTGPELQKEVAEAGGIPFRSDVPVEYMSRAELSRYLQDVLDSEYPAAKAEADQRTLLALDLLPPGSDLRALRTKILEENIVGFYDERPGKKRLYAVSAERRLTPANQLILSHEMRHALQDQYADLHGMLPDSVGDFDDRRIAFLSVLEGDATLVMERFLVHRLTGGEGAEKDEEVPPFSLPVPPMPNVPPVLRDQLLLPYFAGREFAQSLQSKGGWNALKQAWSRPPESTEQVLHPEKYDARETPRAVDLSWAPRGGRVVNDGVMGEVLVKTFLGEGAPDAAAAGWGGDRYRVWDVSGRTLLVWRSVWDSPADSGEFLLAAQSRFSSHTSEGTRHGFRVFAAAPWRYALAERAGGVDFVSSDDPQAFEAALEALGGP